MKLQNYKRLIKTDFDPEQEALVEQIGDSINPGIEFLYQALNKKLTISDNFLGTERDVIVLVDGNGRPVSDTFVTSDFGAQVRTLFVGKAENLTNPTVYPTAAVFVSWSNTSNGIQILNVRGLPAGNSFRLRLVMFG